MVENTTVPSTSVVSVYSAGPVSTTDAPATAFPVASWTVTAKDMEVSSSTGDRVMVSDSSPVTCISWVVS